MVRSIVKDQLFLRQKSEDAVKGDEQIITDLQDTLSAHHDTCVGLAANMIGYRKRIIIVAVGPLSLVMINPVIVKKSGPYEAEEGCLSLDGVRSTTRYKKITVTYKSISWKQLTQDFSGVTAEIIQHECDHLEGILI